MKLVIKNLLQIPNSFVLFNRNLVSISKIVNFENKPAQMDSNYDETQLKLMNEECIQIDNNDRITGSVTKKDCHLLENIKKGILHRAFSVFLFDSNKRLLLQQRSDHKITYPNHWTNTCCSHPLFWDQEKDETDNIGIKRAAIRRVNYELGIDTSELKLESIDYLTRILYKAENIPRDNLFGEHEIDYILFIKGDYKINPNTNEVKSIKYVTITEMLDMIEEEKRPNSELLLTPWFKLISEKFLFEWWKNLDNLDKFKDHKTIHRFI